VPEIGAVFQTPIAIVLADERGTLAGAAHPASLWSLDETNLTLARQAHGDGKPVESPGAPPAPGALFLPLATGKSRVGVLAVRFEKEKGLSSEDRDLLEAFLDHIAAMVERYNLIAQSHRMQLAEESERLYRTLFSSVSHELKTPLSVINAAASELQALADDANPPHAYLNDIVAATGRLQRVVDNLLDMSRIESGRLAPDLTWVDVDEILSEACGQAAGALVEHRVTQDIPENLPAVQTDSGFLAHAVANLLINAAQNSPDGSEIAVRARVEDRCLIVEVADRGPGIPPELLGRVFEKFYRGPGATPGGTGLGLSIVQGLTRALGGEASARNRPEGGAVFMLRRPVQTTQVGG
jgi:two-component system sensor histidine kinase KdpD